MATLPEYKLLDCASVEELNKEVNLLIAEGWEVYGYPAVKPGVDSPDYAESISFCQAMIKPGRVED